AQWQSVAEGLQDGYSAGGMTSRGSSVIGPIAEKVARKIADLRSMGWSSHVSPEGRGDDGTLSATDANTIAPLRGRRTQQSVTATTAYWPVPSAMLEQLDRLLVIDGCSAWSERVEQLCIELCQTSPGDLRPAAGILQQLRALAYEAETLDRSLGSVTATAD